MNHWEDNSRTVTLAMTGGSGAQYGLRLLECLLAARCQVYLLLSSAAEVVINTETSLDLPAGLDEQQAFFEKRYGATPGQLTLFARDDWFSHVESGSSSPA
jgi:4-hydroxy-3-polyprenylbenzoate decarboxylase